MPLKETETPTSVDGPGFLHLIGDERERQIRDSGSPSVKADPSIHVTELPIAVQPFL